MKYFIGSISFIIATILLVLFYINPDKASKDFALGLDLSGGAEITYAADISNIPESEIKGSLSSLRSILQKRLNSFGTSEVQVVTQKGSFFNGDGSQYRKVSVSIPGVTDTNEAKKKIGDIPVLVFKIQNDKYTPDSENELPYLDSGLYGKHVKRAALDFSEYGEPIISLVLNKEGSDIFEKVTSENINKILAIYLDGEIISEPYIRDRILGGNAQITGDFTIEESRALVNSLNFGALPLPIKEISTSTISPSLGGETLSLGITAGIIGFLLVCLFLIIFL